MHSKICYNKSKLEQKYYVKDYYRDTMKKGILTASLLGELKWGESK